MDPGNDLYTWTNLIEYMLRLYCSLAQLRQLQAIRLFELRPSFSLTNPFLDRG